MMNQEMLRSKASKFYIFILLRVDLRFPEAPSRFRFLITLAHDSLRFPMCVSW